MKKLIILAVAIISITASAFATSPVKINASVLKAFNKTFARSSNVEWIEKKEFVRAKFTNENQIMYAYYKPDGELIAVTRDINTTQLPMNLSAELAGKYSDHYIAELFELSTGNETYYYVILRNAKHSLRLEGTAAGGWTKFSATFAH